MPTINGTAVLADGSALALAVVSAFPLEHPAFMSDGRMVSRSRVQTRTSTAGVWSISLEPGMYRIAIDPLDEVRINVPSDPEVDEYNIADLVSTVDGVTPAGAIRTKWFDTIGDMLAEDSRIYATATVRNSYGSDGIISGWLRVLKTSPEAEGLEGGTDNVLESNDEFSFWVRTWISS